MKKFMLVYFGGNQPKPEERETVMNQWTAWFTELGEAVVDSGFPMMPSSKRLMADMSDTEGKSGITGYSILKSENMEDAIEMAKKCPHLMAGGKVEIMEEMPLNM